MVIDTRDDVTSTGPQHSSGFFPEPQVHVLDAAGIFLRSLGDVAITIKLRRIRRHLRPR